MKPLKLAALLIAAGAWAPAAAEQPAASAPAAVQADQAGATVDSIYGVEKLRDPFSNESGRAAVTYHKFSSADFSIHNLTLKGVMADGRSSFALFFDMTSGNTLMLKQGRLLDPRGRPLQGVTGKLDVKRKRADLQTRDGDVQVFRLGAQSND